MGADVLLKRPIKRPQSRFPQKWRSAGGSKNTGTLEMRLI